MLCIGEGRSLIINQPLFVAMHFVTQWALFSFGSGLILAAYLAAPSE